MSLVGCAARAAQCPADTSAVGGLGIRNDNTFEEDIRELLAVTRALEMGAQVGGTLIKLLSAQYPQVPVDFWEKVNAELTGDRFLAVMIPVYQKHLTQDEVRTLVSFYKTPTGSSVIAKMPALTQESMALGGQLGQELAAEFINRARATGYKL